MTEVIDNQDSSKETFTNPLEGSDSQPKFIEDEEMPPAEGRAAYENALTTEIARLRESGDFPTERAGNLGKRLQEVRAQGSPEAAPEAPRPKFIEDEDIPSDEGLASYYNALNTEIARLRESGDFPTERAGNLGKRLLEVKARLLPDTER